MKRFGAYIKQKRLKLKITREKFADTLDISTNYLYQFETGKKVPAAEVILQIAKELNVSAGYIFDLLDDSPRATEHRASVRKQMSLPDVLTDTDIDILKTLADTLAFRREAELKASEVTQGLAQKVSREDNLLIEKALAQGELIQQSQQTKNKV